MNKSFLSFIAILITVIACSSHKPRKEIQETTFLRALIPGKTAMIPTSKNHGYRNEVDSEGEDIYDIFLD